MFWPFGEHRFDGTRFESEQNNGEHGFSWHLATTDVLNVREDSFKIITII